MSMLFMAFLLHAAGAATPDTGKIETPAKSDRVCRDMMVSSSRLGLRRVCKTRAAWQRWERCRSATRYCPPPVQQTVTVVSLPGDKLVCKYLKTTGSRVGQQKNCATERQWDLAEQETQETIRNRQNQSIRTCGGERC